MSEKPAYKKGFNPFGDLVGLDCFRQENGRSHCRLDVAPSLLNPNGVVHGAAIYALADTAMGGALVSQLPPGQPCTTVEIKISYFKAVRDGTVSCEARVVHQGKRIAFLEAEVRNGDVLVAQATGTFAILFPSNNLAPPSAP